MMNRSLKVRILLKSGHVVRVTISRDAVLVELGAPNWDMVFTTLFEKMSPRELWSAVVDDTIGTGIIVGSDKGGIKLNILRLSKLLLLDIDGEETSISLPGEVLRIQKASIE